ncbi:MAG: SIMPL domain-containing protein [Candidatus Saccharibacteria bacterium]|nr:SIMPL domain-containing protein [Pseudorhodobacter sp.]
MLKLSPLLLVLALSLPGMAARADSTLTVTGTASVAATPDLATIQLGVTTNGATAGEAMKANSTALAAVIARLQAAGIEARDYQTTNLSLNPNWVSNAAGTGSEMNGYIATNLLTIKVRAVDQVGTVLDAAITDGANTLNYLTFGLQDPRPVEDEARKRAVADAMARATLIATAAGAKLGQIQSITEGGGAGPIPGPMFKMAAEQVPVAAGEVETTVAITMEFELTQ